MGAPVVAPDASPTMLPFPSKKKRPKPGVLPLMLVELPTSPLGNDEPELPVLPVEPVLPVVPVVPVTPVVPVEPILAPAAFMVLMVF